MGWLGIIALIGVGIFLGLFLNGLKNAKGNMLQQGFVKLGTLVGLSLDEIKSNVGAPNQMSTCIVAENGKPGSLHTWVQNPYSITLLFDENLLCLGVNKETKL